MNRIVDLSVVLDSAAMVVGVAALIDSIVGLKWRRHTTERILLDLALGGIALLLRAAGSAFQTFVR